MNTHRRLHIKNLELVFIGDFYFGNRSLDQTTDSGVEDFLSAIYYADYVITHSFHCTAFSTIFEKRFSSQAITRAGSRVSDYLNTLGLQDHVIDDSADVSSENIDYTTVRKKLIDMGWKSRIYLKSIITIEADEMYLQTKGKSDCCGCTACVTVCPKKCLVMEEDEYGFLFPRIEKLEQCIHCHRCEVVCPIEKNKSISPKEKYPAPICLSGWHQDESVRATSTSGAAFVGIVQACEKNGFSRFYGVRYDDELMAIHTGVDSAEEIACLVSTKYVQSNVGNSFFDVMSELQTEKKVVFSGTPCQVEGLQNVVPNNLRDNLITIALVCHGVSSPEAYKKYIKEVGEKNTSSVSSIKFRDKRQKNGELSHRFTTITLQNGKVLTDTENLYTLTFGLGLMHRECCSSCPYATPYRSADFSIGDFWGIEDYKPELKSEIPKGISLIYAHSERAKNLLAELRKTMLLNEEPLEHSLHIRQQQLRMPFARNPRRDQFLKKVITDGLDFEAIAEREFQRWRYINFAKRVARKVLRRR